MANKHFELQPNSQVIMACLISGIYDVNRNETLEDDNFELVRDWAESIENLHLRGIIFHNNLSSKTCKEFQNDHISFIRIAYKHQFNPNVYRYFAYRNFLKQYREVIKSIFITDISDVVVIKNPFTDSFFSDHPNAIFCGDEPQVLNNEWMQAHGNHLRQRIPAYEAFEKRFGKETLLNCGIIGGSITVFHDFINRLCAIHQKFNTDNQTAYTGDMGAFNYLARMQFNEQLRHGAPVNTIFKQYENERTDCWFRHK